MQPWLEQELALREAARSWRADPSKAVHRARRRPAPIKTPRPTPQQKLDNLLENRRMDRLARRAAEKDEIAAKAKLGVASPEEIDRLIGPQNRYGKV
jgi:hypothetical protein